MSDRLHSRKPALIKNLWILAALAYLSLYVWARQNSLLVHATTTRTDGDKQALSHSIENADCGIPLLNPSYCYLVTISGWVFLPFRLAETAYWYIVD
ncbi:MAG: hypothetical protein WBA24_15755 [Geitlerinemataceae cyanobacterium]